MRAAPELCGDRLTEAHTWERGVVPRVGKLKRATLAREVESSTKQWHEQWMRTADANQQRIEMQLSGAAFSNSLQSPRYRSCMTPLVNVSNLQCPSVCFLCCLRLPRCVSTRTTGLSSRDRWLCVLPSGQVNVNGRNSCVLVECILSDLFWQVWGCEHDPPQVSTPRLLSV